MRNRGGFTIIETLVVLGVTAVLFVAVIGSLTGRQDRIQFSQGMRDINSSISDVLNDVTTGYFPTIAGLVCVAGTSSDNPAPQLTYDATAGDKTGARKDCVFAGKVIQIGTNASASEGFVYSLTGRRLTFNGTDSSDVASFAELKPVVVDPLNTNNVSGFGASNISATTSLKLPYGIKIVQSDGSDGGRAIGIFYKNFRGVSLNGQTSSGVTSVAIADVWSATSDPSISMTQASVIAAADETDTLNSKFLSGSGTIVLCFKSETTDQTATITIGDGIQGNLDLDYDVVLSGVLCV